MTLLEEARGLIKAYLASKPHLSVAALAKAAGMPPTTARTIVQGEIRKTAIENIVSLLATFMDYEAIQEVIGKYGLGSAETGYVTLLVNRKQKFVANVDTDGFEYVDPDHEILALASSSHGITRQRILALYGQERGDKRVDALLNAGLIREINGKLKLHDEYVSYPIRDTVKKVTIHASRWSHEDVKSGGFLYHITQNYTEEAHQKALALTKEYIQKLAELEKDNSHGDKVVMVSILGNLLDGDKS